MFNWREFLIVAVSALSFLIGLGTIACFIAGIWLGDERWAHTGIVGIFLTGGAFLFAYFVAEADWNV